jgi:hypothetical protein
MKKLIAAIIITIAAGSGAGASDFWDIYSRKLTYNYVVKTGAIPERIQFGQRLSNDEMVSVLTKTFSQALGERMKSAARQSRPIAIACIFTPEPERCFADQVLGLTFDEVHFINAPGFSNKFIKSISKYYSYTLNGDDDALQRRIAAAGKVPQRKKFNPRFGFNLNEPELMVSSPFYSFFGVYVEPRFGTKRGPTISFMRGKYFVDFQKEGVSLKYRLKQGGFGRGYTSITIRPEGEFYISNELILK